MAESTRGRSVPKKVWEPDTGRWLFIGNEWQTLGYFAKESGFDGDMPTHCDEQWLIEHVTKTSWAIVTVAYFPAADYATDAEIRAISPDSAVEWLFDAEIECPPQLQQAMNERGFAPKIVSNDRSSAIQEPIHSSVAETKMSSMMATRRAIEITAATEFTSRTDLAKAIGCSVNNAGLKEFWKRYHTKQPTKKITFAPELAVDDDPLKKLIAGEEIERLTKAQAAEMRAEGKPRRQKL